MCGSVGAAEAAYSIPGGATGGVFLWKGSFREGRSTAEGRDARGVPGGLGCKVVQKRNVPVTGGCVAADSN